MLERIWLIPVLPAAGALLQLLFGRKLSNWAVSLISVGLPGVSFVWALGCFNELLGQPEHTFAKTIYTWLPAGAYHLSSGALANLNVNVGFQLDPLSAAMLLVVTGVGFLIHIYSIGYMGHEGGYYRFFGYMNLFMFSMLVLVLADNYLMMFVGWEGVGLCSYLLIGFYFQRKSAADAGKKAFIVNRIGDAGFLLGLMLMAVTFGTLNFHDVTAAARSGQFAVGDAVITAICILLFVGATGKSAQIPLYVWLPDAMEGPTPVSALIHAATMVTAGVYMVARSNALFVLAPTSMKTVAIIGALTAVFAASIGLVQNDIKRVLAYSTVSQLGYMFLALGVGAFAAGVFHVFTHSFFKALLFLGAGSVIHALSGEQDLRNMGDLAHKIPTTFKTMLIATLAIAGIPPLAGFVSKDEILWRSWLANPILWAIGFATALMTAFYMFRLVYLTFWSPSRMDHEVEHHIHESPKSMTVPLIILAFFCITAGWLGWPGSLGGSNHFEKFLEPVFARGNAASSAEAAQPGGGEKHRGIEIGLMLLSVAAAGVGWGMASRAYRPAGKGYGEPIAAAAPLLYNALYNKYYVDEAYDYAFTGRRKVGEVRLGVMGLGEASSSFDEHVIDGTVNGAGWTTRLTANISKWWDTWIIDGVLVNGLAIMARMLSYPTRLLQRGLVQWYALVMVAGLVYFVCLPLGYARWFWIVVAALVLLTLGYLLARYVRDVTRRRDVASYVSTTKN